MFSILSAASGLAGLGVLGLGIAIMVMGKGCKSKHILSFEKMNYATIGGGAGIALFAALGMFVMKTTHPMIGGILNLIFAAGVGFLSYMQYMSAKKDPAPCNKVMDEVYGLMGCAGLLLVVGVVGIIAGMKKGGGASAVSKFF